MVYKGRLQATMVVYYFYKIVCNDLNIKHTYIGSTVNFTRRKSAHKFASTDPKKTHQKIYSCMAANGGWDCWQMVLIEKHFYETKLEAHRHERFYYEQLNADISMNTYSPQQDVEERLAYKKDYYKDYRETNKDAIASYKKDYRETNKVKFNCSCGGRYTRPTLSQHIKTNKHQSYIAQIKKL